MRPYHVAIVGSGPSGYFAAASLLKFADSSAAPDSRDVRVDVLEMLPTPWGLVRSGVAPDHPKIKTISAQFEKIASDPRFRFFGNIRVGEDVQTEELADRYDAVIYAVGAQADRPLGIPGEDLPGSVAAVDFVGWYNAHPHFEEMSPDLSTGRAVVVGNGNVALDVARILTTDPDVLARTDVSDHALATLRTSRVQEVVVAARRGPSASAFTLPELIGLTNTHEVVLSADDHALVQQDLTTETDPLTRNKLEVLAKLGDASAPIGRPRIRLAYRLTPLRVLGDDHVEGVEFTVTGTDEVRELATGMVLTSIGYRGKPIRDLPFDESAAIVPNDGGRVAGTPGVYVAGWIKRGPTGFIGTNKSCAAETVHNLVADYNAGLLPDPSERPSALDRLVRTRQPAVVDAAGWKAIDAAEIARGGPDRPRDKFTAIPDMIAAAATAPTPSLGQRLLAGLRL